MPEPKVIKNRLGKIIQVDNYKLKDYIRFECENGGFADITLRVVYFWENSKHSVNVQFEKYPPFKIELSSWNGSRLANQREIDAYIKVGGPTREC